MPRPSNVYYFARIVPAYRIAVLSRLNDRLDGRLVVCAGDPPGGSALGTIGGRLDASLAHVHLKNVWIAGERLHAQDFRPAFEEYGPASAILAEESPRSISLPLLMVWAHRHRVPIGLWGHFSSNRRGMKSATWRDRYRRLLARRADACICYTESIAELLDDVPQDRKFVATNTLDTTTLFDLYDRLAEEGRRAVRRRLGLPGEMPILAFSGRLTPEKNVELLMETVGTLQREQEVALVVIGDGPKRGEMESWALHHGLRHVHFLGAMPSFEDSAPYLFASDLMVLPGVAGLAVNHAFSMGLPVLTRSSPTDARYHGPEIAYVESGRNGLIVPDASPGAMAAGVREILGYRASYAEAARTYAREHLQLERMVDGLETAVRYLEGRRGSA